MLARRAKSSLGPQARHARRIRHARAALEAAPDNNIAGGPSWSARQRRLNPLGCGRRLRWAIAPVGAAITLEQTLPGRVRHRLEAG